MGEFQKWGIGDNGEKTSQLRLKCDKCGKVINISDKPKKNEHNNGGCGKICCDKCKTYE